MFSSAFLSALLERAVKTFAQVLGSLLAADGLGILDSNWGDNLSVAGMAAFLSVLTTIASGWTTGGQASLTKAEITADDVVAVKDKGVTVAGPGLAEVPDGLPVAVTPA